MKKQFSGKLQDFFDRTEMNERQERLLDTLKFFFKLLFAGLIFQAILYIYPDTTGFQAFLAQIVAAIIDPLMDDKFTASGIKVITENIHYVITQDCMGWKSAAAFTGLLFASSDRFRSHFKALIIGNVVIFLANILRIVTTIFLSHRGIISFGIIHDTLWKWSLTGLVLVLWMLWFEETQRDKNIFGGRGEKFPGLQKILSKR